MIDGLKLTLTGEDLRRLLHARAAAHRAAAAHWTREAERTVEDQTEEHPLLPQHMCEHEADRCAWRADVLDFIRDHLEPLEIYRLGESDLAFGDVLPARPAALEQEESEERTRVGFELGQISRRLCSLPEIIHVTNPDASRAD
jgi:hypothetical protein